MEERNSALNPPDISFDFKLIHLKTAPVTYVRNLSIIATILSVYQIVYACISADPNLWDNVILGSVDFIASLFVLIWSAKVVKNQDNPLQASEHGFFNANNALVSSSILLVRILSWTALSWIRRSYTASFLSLHPEVAAEQHEALNYWLLWVNTWGQVFIILTLLYSIKVAWKNVENEDQAVSNLVLWSVVALSISTGLTIASTELTDTYASYKYFVNSDFQWTNCWLFSLNIGLAVVSLLTWVAYHKQWRIGYLFLWAVIVILLFFALPLSGRAYQTSQELNSYYKNLGAERTAAALAYVNKASLAEFWCEKKYLDESVNCEHYEEFAPWEQTDSRRYADSLCVNSKCAPSLVATFTNQFYVLFVRAMDSALSGVVVLAAISYFLYHGITLHDGEGAPGKNWAGLAFVLIGCPAAWALATFVLAEPAIQVFPGKVSEIAYASLTA